MRAIVIPDLLHRLGIEGVERKGRELWAPCPMHEEADPSWQIHDEPGGDRHGFFRCFGCGFGGGPVALVRALLGCGSKEARAFLESSEVMRATGGIEIVSRATVRRADFKLPSSVRFEGWPSTARAYLQSRRIDDAARLRWGLGVAAFGRLAGRIVVVVRDELGRPRSYTARSFVGSAKRYLEPTAEEHATHDVLFGEEHWPEQHARDWVVVVEGPFDAMAVDAACRLPVAGARGAQLLPRQALVLSTFRRVVVAGDADKAGRWLNLQVQAIGRHVPVVVRDLGGKDPAAVYEAEGPDGLRRRLRI